MVHARGMRYERLWERLLEYVNEWASVREMPGGFEVTFESAPGVTRTVDVVVTSAQWEDYVSTVYGTGDPRFTPFKSEVLATPVTARYLVYDRSFDWQPSETRELPVDDIDPGSVERVGE